MVILMPPCALPQSLAEVFDNTYLDEISVSSELFAITHPFYLLLRVPKILPVCPETHIIITPVATTTIRNQLC